VNSPTSGERIYHGESAPAFGGPTTEKRTVTPRRLKNAELRSRVPRRSRVDKLIEAAKGNRYGDRDAHMILLAYRHGLRASELVECHAYMCSARGSIGYSTYPP
jgi:hypothetical protein